MFGMAATFNPNDTSGLGSFLPAPYNDNSFMGDQVRGVGFLHDGSVDTMFRFHGGTVFAQRAASPTLPGNPGGFSVITDPNDPVLAQQELLANLTKRRQVEAFMFAFDSNLAPIVGQQATLTKNATPDVLGRIDLLEARAVAGECDLVVKGLLDGRNLGFLFDAKNGMFIPDTVRAQPLTSAFLRGLTRRGTLTFTAVPPGSGVRIGLDRDSNGVFDGDESGSGVGQDRPVGEQSP